MRKMLLLLVCLCVMCTPFTINAQETEVTENGKVVEVPVKAIISSTFTVKLPSSISLSDVSGGYSYAGQIGVKGDLMSGASIEVLTDDKITMYDITLRETNDVPSNVDDQQYPHKKECSVAVDLSETLFDEVSAGSYTPASLSLLAKNMSAGKWKGNLTFNIKYNKPDRSGLYNADGSRIATWQELIEEGTINCVNGTVFTNVNVQDLTNASSERLAGKLVLHEDVTGLLPVAFGACENLTGILIPGGVTEIPYGAFAHCTNLEIVELPSNILSLGEGAFLNCTRLEIMELPDSVTRIGASAFSDCTSLKRVKLSSSLQSIETNAFVSCSELSSINLPDSLASIGDGAFGDCIALKEVSIPDSVNSIGDYAFNQCSNLERVKLPSNITHLSDYLFSGCTKLKEVSIPNSVTTIGDYAFNVCSSLEHVKLPSNITNLSNYLFSGCVALKQVDIPNGVTAIGEYAFNDCTGIEDVTIPSSVNYIGIRSFNNCISITDLRVPTSVNTIGTLAFNGVSHVTYNGAAIGSPWGACSIN